MGRRSERNNVIRSFVVINTDVKEIGDGSIFLYRITRRPIDKYETKAESHLPFNIVTEDCGTDCAIDRHVRHAMKTFQLTFPLTNGD